MANPTYRSHASTNYLGAQTNTVVTAPAGIVNGDMLLFALLIAGASPVTPTPPAGLTLLAGPSTQTSAGFSVVRRLYYKVAASESGNYTFTHASSTSQGFAVCVSDPGDVPVVTDNGGIGFTTNALGLTVAANSWIGFLVHNWVLYGTASPPTGTTPTFTERLDTVNTLLYFAEGIYGAGGATGDKTQANLNTDDTATYSWGAFLISVPSQAPVPPADVQLKPNRGTRPRPFAPGRAR